MDSVSRSHSAPETDDGAARHAPLTVTAFVLILAWMMSINALATDIMLPAFPDMALALGDVEVTRIQAIITAYMFGFALSQLFIGFVTDRYGRRPVLLGGLVVYSIAAIFCALAGDLSELLLWRFIQGIGSGAPRIVTTAALRDCYEGRRMARIMSLVMTVFMAVPILAPAIGQILLLFTDWRWVLASLAIYGGALFLFCLFRFPETLAPERRRMIRWSLIREALASIASSRQTVGYALGAGAFLGPLFGFIGSAQQVMVGVFDLGVWFPVAFAVPAISMSASSFVNGLLVERLGVRRLSHFAVIAYTVVATVMAILAIAGQMGLWSFLVLQTVLMLFVGLVFANFNSLAMEPQGHVAGAASSFVSAVTVILGASIGYFIGGAFDGTAAPLVIGYAVCGFVTLGVVFITERGRLFRTRFDLPTA